MRRRDFVLGLLGTGSALLLPRALLAKDTITPLVLDDEAWRKRLTPTQFQVLREEGTERPFSSALNEEHRNGMFICVACALPLFPSTYKFDSGTGWPSFFDVLPGHVVRRADTSLGMMRTEYHCARCGGHHGHLFDDGPDPTGLRYCNNGVALAFVPGKTSHRPGANS